MPRRGRRSRSRWGIGRTLRTGCILQHLDFRLLLRDLAIEEVVQDGADRRGDHVGVALGDTGLEQLLDTRQTTGDVVTDAALVDAITPALGEALGTVRPAATMVVAGLIRPEMKVEIEVTALRE